MISGKRHTVPLILLASVALIWGSTFSLMKNTLVRTNVNSFLAWRFIAAALLMALLRPKAFKEINKAFLLRGVIIGTLLGVGYLFQTYGLTMTTVAKTGFITGLYSVFVPLVAAGIFRDRVTKSQWVAVSLAAIGLGFLSLNGISIGLGEFLVLMSAIFFAFHIVALSHWSPGRDAYALTMIQMATCGIISLVFSAKNGVQLPPDRGVWVAILYSAIFASAIAFMVQTWTQSFMSATTVGVVLTLEYIFAAIFGLLFSHEHLTWRTLIGGTFVMAGLYLIVLMEGREKIEA
jgi:drug/metabolite transporter (DMT)-like permease